MKRMLIFVLVCFLFTGFVNAENVFRVSSVSNAHVGTLTGSSSSYLYINLDKDIVLDGAHDFWLSDTNNAHTSTFSVSPYFGIDFGQRYKNCALQSSKSCPTTGSWECIVELSGATNAHVSGCGQNDYNWFCCEIDFCGDGVCGDDETFDDCPGDCLPGCGDDECTAGECSSCPDDCTHENCCGDFPSGILGDGTCDIDLFDKDETCGNCPGDCGACECTVDTDCIEHYFKEPVEGKDSICKEGDSYQLIYDDPTCSVEGDCVYPQMYGITLCNIVFGCDDATGGCYTSDPSPVVCVDCPAMKDISYDCSGDQPTKTYTPQSCSSPPTCVTGTETTVNNGGVCQYGCIVGGSSPSTCEDAPPEPLVVSLECGADFTIGTTTEISVTASDPDGEITGNVTVDGIKIMDFTNGYSAVDYTWELAGNLRVEFFAVKGDGSLVRKIANVMVTDSSTADYVAACIDSPVDFSDIASSKVWFDASSSRGLRCDEGVCDEVGVEGLMFYWNFSEEELVKLDHDGSESEAYKFHVNFATERIHNWAKLDLKMK